MMPLTQQTLFAYENHIAEAANLYVRTKLSSTDGVVAYLLTTESLSDEASMDALREAELRQYIQEVRPPFWLALPVQAVACVLYALFMLALGVGYMGLGPLYVFARGVSALARGVRWALC